MRKRNSMLLAVAAFALGLSAVSAQAETVVRYGISMADIPLTTGQPDRGAGAYQFSAYTIYDPLVAWEMDVADRPGKLVPGLATEWKVDDADKKKWRFTLRKGVKFHDGSDFNADAVIWNLDKVLEREGAAVRQAPERAGQDAPAVGGELRQGRRQDRRDHHQGGQFLLPLPDAVVPGLQPRAIRKARQGLGQVRQPALRHRTVQADQARSARTRRTQRRMPTTGTRSGCRRPTRSC